MPLFFPHYCVTCTPPACSSRACLQTATWSSRSFSTAPAAAADGDDDDEEYEVEGDDERSAEDEGACAGGRHVCLRLAALGWSRALTCTACVFPTHICSSTCVHLQPSWTTS